MIPGRIQQILCTGNLCTSDTYEYLRSVCSDVHVVQGDFDNVGSWPLSKTITHGQYKLGLIHGHQIIPWGHPLSLDSQARQMGADILIFGHTHILEAYVSEGAFFVNPGSATGSYTSLGGSASPIPSFVLLDIQDHLVTAYIYKLIDGEVKVEPLEQIKVNQVLSLVIQLNSFD
ncbi:Vacuolar protein sorting-associated protein 29, variant 2 [Entomophthora muscae]|uniref:Vacuolar protein sorting-associated protein 29, variant 2 n=1 Tax=Entomophthora muscae TaxID=34485 RepID=A0ACC2SZR4_9FUNG|nr:Vacuolar protein sorting-associated protein 29, variant 2 [Entomophthora muscae]